MHFAVVQCNKCSYKEGSLALNITDNLQGAYCTLNVLFVLFNAIMANLGSADQRKGSLCVRTAIGRA